MAVSEPLTLPDQLRSMRQSVDADTGAILFRHPTLLEHWAACWQNRSSSSFLWAWETERHRWDSPLSRQDPKPERTIQPPAANKGLLPPGPARVAAQAQLSALLDARQPQQRNPCTQGVMRRLCFVQQPLLISPWVTKELASAARLCLTQAPPLRAGDALHLQGRSPKRMSLTSP
jgi:hypothetical protein